MHSATLTALFFEVPNTFSGDSFAYFGLFTALRPELTLWRLRKLNAVLAGRSGSISGQVEYGLIPKEQLPLVERIWKTLRILVCVTSDADRQKVSEALENTPLGYEVELITIEEISKEIEKIS
jgi:hypothetical protein